MRLKLDENLGVTWINGLRDRGHDVDTVSDEGIGGAFDTDVLAAAAGANRAALSMRREVASAMARPRSSGVLIPEGPWTASALDDAI